MKAQGRLPLIGGDEGCSQILTQARRVAIGKKSDRVFKSRDNKEFRLPMMLDYFRVSLMERGEDGDFVLDQEFHDKHGAKPTSVPIELPFNRPNLNAMVYCAVYSGRKSWCKGNCEKAYRLQKNGDIKEVPCPCEYLEGPVTIGPGKVVQCKYHMRFQFFMPGLDFGEAAVLRSTGSYTLDGVAKSLHQMQTFISRELQVELEEVPMSGIPFELKLQKRTVPGPDGKSYTITQAYVTYKGSGTSLVKAARERLRFVLENGDLRKRVEQERELEFIQTKRLLEQEVGSDVEEIVEEFHPDQVDDIAALPEGKRHRPSDMEDIEELEKGSSKKPAKKLTEEEDWL